MPTPVDELYPACVVTEAMSPISADPAELDPVEATAIARAVPKRRLEFAAGRNCARRALARLGFEHAVIPSAADRSPVWPAGVVGSISHCGGFCGVVVARQELVDGLGFDVEPAAPLEHDLWPVLFTPEERRWLRQLPTSDRGVWARLLFSAKESAYKCHRSARGGWLDFHDVEVVPDLAAGTMALRVAREDGVGRPDRRLVGRFAVDSDWILTGMTLLDESATAAGS